MAGLGSAHGLGSLSLLHEPLKRPRKVKVVMPLGKKR